ncbi:glycosyltransferase family 4 protein [Candidatus Woesearchaeota archaeon]|nr:glycosyltransferase family 4 protein [Candidatus Woesearchaeota archaeon]
MGRLFLVLQQFDPDAGSYSAVFRRLAEHATKQGYSVTITCDRKTGQPAEELTAYATIRRFPSIRAPVFSMIIAALRRAHNTRAYFKTVTLTSDDIIIANGEAALGLAGLPYVLRAGDQPANTFLENMQRGKVRFISRIARRIHILFQSIIEKRVLRKANGLIFASSETRDLFVQTYALRTTPWFVPRSGIEPRPIRATPKKMSLLFIADAHDRIRKGAQDLEQALPTLFDEFKELMLIHVGQPFTWDVPAWCQNRIRSVGRIPWDAIHEYYEQASIVVSCSLSEGFPNVILEAMAAGKPIVTSDINGINEYLEDGIEGLVYHKGAIDELIEKVRFLLKNPGRARSVGRAAKTRIRALAYPVYERAVLEFARQVRQGRAQDFNLLKRS